MIFDCVFFIVLVEEGAPGPCAVAGGGDVGFDDIDFLAYFWFVVVEFVIES